MNPNERSERFKDYISHDLLVHGRAYSPLLKDCSFKEEKEWRIFGTHEYPLQSEIRENIDVRNGRSNLVPFVNLAFNEKGNCFPKISDWIDEVIIGPGANQILTSKALKVADPSLNVVCSNIPYRNW